MSQFNDSTIKKVIEEINMSYFVPDIQREYVWLRDPKERKIENLFDSLLRGYPIGSFLIWKIKKTDVASNRNNQTDNDKLNIQLYKFVENYDERTQHNEPIDIEQINSNDLNIILDGQQRLTSLYIGLKGSIKIRKKYYRASSSTAYEVKKLYINLKHIPDPENPDDNYDIRFRSDEEISECKGTDAELWFKMGDVLDMSYENIHDYVNEHGFKDAVNILSRMNAAFSNDAKISFFEEDKKELSKVLNIFIRVNSGGSKLSYSDLLMSILTANFSTNIRDLMNELVDGLKERGFKETGRDQVLKTCLLLTDSPHAFTLKNFGKDNISKIENHWDKIQESIWFAVERLSDCGYKGQLSSAYILSTIALFHYNEKIMDDEDVGNFVKMAQVKHYFANSLDNRLDTIKNYMKESESFFEFNKKMYNDKKYSLSITVQEIEQFKHLKYSDVTTFPVLQMLYPCLDYKSLSFHIDHIYPKSKFNKNNTLLDKNYLERGNELFNLQLLRGDINNTKRAKDPEIWLKEMCQTEDKIAQYKESNYIRKDLQLEWNNIKEFEECRRAMLIEKLKEEFAKIQKGFTS